jgi:hypothetical protein
MQFSDEKHQSLVYYLLPSYHNPDTLNTYTFQIFKNEERLKMNLKESAKTLIMQVKIPIVELPSNFSNNTTIPIILTENDSTINV